jgi:drug/metabolite transporter superfamily protein YnfA
MKILKTLSIGSFEMNANMEFYISIITVGQMYRAYGHIYILLSFCDIVDELIPQIK